MFGELYGKITPRILNAPMPLSKVENRKGKSSWKGSEEAPFARRKYRIARPDHYSSFLDEGADDSASVGGEGSGTKVRDVLGNGLANYLVVVCICANPEPHDSVRGFNPQRPIVEAHTS
jgi:hypothetical protein